MKFLVDGRHENWPVARSCIRRLVEGGWDPAFAGTPANCEEAWLALMPRAVAARVRGTLLTREVPFTPEDPDAYEYPCPDEANARHYRKCSARACQNPRLLICGRLGEYRYYGYGPGHRTRPGTRRPLAERRGAWLRLPGTQAGW
ncbi:hypothetical protein TVNIR_3038 [Thioalkalivibrio nitratireducens DSM 14787]|uniref:UDP-galactopyranose mutase C-terminal domain-containing protein n=1 Tax=Thioalkalivibrio nitratireducens (strain DSM 14787 / UNIQEM 213 / ALEN2) TaxID=1255043 RepID=L0E0D7_THIND|nr:UDP-galactopyranose mutase [Thioalkalivibrio nitratireducens]AGA34675.1 hypothetical protein TVNIR_3038 [Thioalkalivibrio nitratireducens DSM 14787]